uniref:VCBS repeat-containing protein n=1 Tax=Maribacter sp. TaxID=1897614 RepID=UPI0025BCAE1F
KSNMSGMNPNSFWKVVNDGGHYQYMYNAMQLNNGNTTFSDIAQFTGMAATDWSWSNLIADFDNDGLKDTYITNGLLHDIRNTDADKKVGKYITETANAWVKDNPNRGDVSIWDILDLKKTIDLIPSQPLKNYAFKNKGDLEFEKITEGWGLDQASFSNGSAYADFDNDGDLDLVVNNINKKAFVYRNNSETFTNSNYLRVELKDIENKTVFGSRVTIYVGGESQIIETTNVRGIYSTSESFVHFGLGDKKRVDSLVVLWPNNSKIIQRNLTANQTIKIKKRGKAEKGLRDRELNNPLFQDITTNFSIRYNHQENDFDDFKQQVLLPHKLSQFGPSLAVGDINNDGLEDVFIGGSTGESSVLYKQVAKGEFVKTNEIFWGKEKAYEDVDAIFVDINNDGFKDLYVVSGGNEYRPNDAHYLDRLYLNDGTGGFRKGAILNLLPSSGSIVKAEDYDGDGDIDLFVGGRHKPHSYPLPTSSMLLKNEKGQLVNVSMDIAQGLKNMGMVTDAVWVDYDLDQDIDLLVVGEWMPITVFENVDNILIRKENEDLKNTIGWWFSIEKGDFDKDGDMDFIAGNLGLNYKYKTTTDKSFDVYYNDFDSNGKGDIVLGYYDGGKHFPVRGFSCSSQQIPGLKKEIKKYDIFASMEIDEVYGGNSLKSSLHYKADTFASSYIENLGNGHFAVSKLPSALQLSNINDMIIEDINNDGNLDMLSVGNLFVSEIETPRNDAGTGNLLLGNGAGGFDVVSSLESGFFANKDAKRLSLLHSKGEKLILVVNNDDVLQAFQVHKNN